MSRMKGLALPVTRLWDWGNNGDVGERGGRARVKWKGSARVLRMKEVSTH